MRTYHNCSVLKRVLNLGYVIAIILLFSSLWFFYGDFAVIHRITSLWLRGTQIYFQESKTGLYGAKVTAFDHGKQLEFGQQTWVWGSTLPDSDSYPTIQSGSYIFERGLHYGLVTNTIFKSKITPALILNPSGTGGRGSPIPTLDINKSPSAGDNYGLYQASQIHVHCGLTHKLKGSTGCLTIAPEQATSFFLSEISNTGVIHILR